jgi:hypothetical protein
MAACLARHRPGSRDRTEGLTAAAMPIVAPSHRLTLPHLAMPLAIEMSERARAIAISGAMAREPGISRDEARLRVLRQILGDALFDAAYVHRKRARAVIRWRSSWRSSIVS